MEGSTKFLFDEVRRAVFDLNDGDQAGTSSNIVLCGFFYRKDNKL